MWEHYLLDNPPANPQGTQDPDYDREESNTDGYEAPDEDIPDKEHRLPLADKEEFSDPDFDEEWNAEDEEEDSDIIGENQSGQDFQRVEEGEESNMNAPMDSDDEEEWEVL